MFCPKWWIHDNRVKLLSISLCLQGAQVTLYQIHVGNLKLLCIPSEDLQSVVVNVEADAETEEDE